MKLFAYGELCKLSVLRRVLGRVPPAVPGLLCDHARRRGADGFYRVRPSPGSSVAGLTLEVRDEDLSRLDAFEDVDGGLYRRKRARVRTLGPAAADVDADVYEAAGAARSGDGDDPA